MKLTVNEKMVLINITENLYSAMNGSVPTEAWQAACWSECIASDGPYNLTDMGKKISGVCSSLVKKELITSNGESIGLTEKGFLEYKNIERP